MVGRRGYNAQTKGKRAAKLGGSSGPVPPWTSPPIGSHPCCSSPG
jgi:hypothetical protein